MVLPLVIPHPQCREKSNGITRRITWSIHGERPVSSNLGLTYTLTVAQVEAQADNRPTPFTLRLLHTWSP